MKCVKCGGITAVINTRYDAGCSKYLPKSMDITYRYRSRKCTVCGHKFSSVEISSEDLGSYRSELIKIIINKFKKI